MPQISRAEGAPAGAPAGAQGRFKTVEHTADWALNIRGQNLEQLFTAAAVGMNSLMVGESLTIPADIRKRFTFSAEDAEALMVDWLSELAYWAETELLIFLNFSFVELSDNRLIADVSGGFVKALEKHIKAVTFHNLNIKKLATHFEATIVFDV